MAQEVGAFEAKTQLSKLLEIVRQGERVTITKHGVPVAQLVPTGPVKRRDVAHIIRELKAIRERTEAGHDSIRSLIEEGRRF